MEGKRCNYLMIMGHMRSRSSLLTHILLTSPDMLGLGESNAIYESTLKLLYMKVKVFLKNRSINFFQKVYVDQINHNSKTPNAKIFRKKNLRIIILVRPPDASIASIMALTKKYYTPWSVEKAAKYYKDRVTYLIKLKNELPSHQYLIINSDELVNKPTIILEEINKFLNISTPLKPEYTTFSFTGISGDPSSNIKAGKIIDNSNFIDPEESKYKKEYELFNDLIDS